MANSKTSEASDDSEATMNEILEEVYDDEEIVKIAVCGDEQIGKSMLLLSARPSNGLVPSPFKAVMVDKTISIDGKTDTVRIELCDTGSTVDYQALRAKAFKNSDIILCCFDISNEMSLTHIEQNWLQEIEQFSAVRPILMLIGLKSDLRDTADADTLISDDDIDRFKAKHGATFIEYMEVSALKKRNVESIFEHGINAFRFKGRHHRKSTVMTPVEESEEDPNDLVGTHQRQWQQHLKEMQSQQQVFAQFTNNNNQPKTKKKKKKKTRRKDTGATDHTDHTDDESDSDSESGSDSESDSGSDSNIDKKPNYNNPLGPQPNIPTTQMQYNMSDPYGYNAQMQQQMYRGPSSFSSAAPNPAFFQPPNMQQVQWQQQMSHSARSLASNGSSNNDARPSNPAASGGAPARPASARYAFHGSTASQNSFQAPPLRPYSHASSRSSGAPLRLSQHNFSLPMHPNHGGHGSGSSQHLFLHGSQTSHGNIPIMNANAGGAGGAQHFAQQHSGSALRLTNAYTLPMQPAPYLPTGGSSRNIQQQMQMSGGGSLRNIQQQMQMGGSSRNFQQQMQMSGGGSSRNIQQQMQMNGGGSSRTLPNIQQQMQMGGGSVRNLAYSTSVDKQQQQHQQQSSLGVHGQHQPSRSMPFIQNGTQTLGQMVNSMQLHNNNNDIPPPPPPPAKPTANEDIHAGEKTAALTKSSKRKLSVSRDRNGSIDYLDSGNEHQDDDEDNRASCRCKCAIL
eukprot:CAMPEP_0202711214 /NCGR_PEP_ID=MMETSP1385-20130828/23057_1 /ASSEMBLY_ACC=CAM_ASM_000861 /TAXON_ID=933848 /ORGANISM="Elphidium margaritaceum" /LENGTH=734 /DNA_ID=CAMNT_0049370901 /DNA_START=26 /DNA_END=2230 /DNA_ORIENTATION=+